MKCSASGSRLARTDLPDSVRPEHGRGDGGCGCVPLRSALVLVREHGRKPGEFCTDARRSVDVLDPVS